MDFRSDNVTVAAQEIIEALGSTGAERLQFRLRTDLRLALGENGLQFRIAFFPQAGCRRDLGHHVVEYSACGADLQFDNRVFARRCSEIAEGGLQVQQVGKYRRAHLDGRLVRIVWRAR